MRESPSSYSFAMLIAQDKPKRETKQRETERDKERDNETQRQRVW